MLILVTKFLEKFFTLLQHEFVPSFYFKSYPGCGTAALDIAHQKYFAASLAMLTECLCFGPIKIQILSRCARESENN